MKESNNNWGGESFDLNGRMNFFCLKLKNQEGNPEFSVFSVQCSFLLGMKFQGIFLIENEFVADFFRVGGGFQPGL